MIGSETMKKLMQSAVLAVLIAVPLAAESAVVVKVQGKVEVNRNGGWVPLAANDSVLQGEVVSTGFKSSALLKYQGASMQLGPLTRVTLETLAQNEKKDTVSVYLNTGGISSNVKRTENKRVSYTVHNPVAVASVRGTEFVFLSTGTITCTAGAVVTYPAAYYTPPAAQEAPAAGESGAGTPAEDIAPGSPRGAVVVLPGQNVSVSPGGFTKKPSESASDTVNSVQNTVSTPVETEREATGGEPGTPAGQQGGGGSGTQTPKTGTIRVNVTIR